MPDSRTNIAADDHHRFTAGDRVSVLLPVPLAGPYDYLVPDEDDFDLAPGDAVVVPFGPRRLRGVVWGPGTGEVAAAKLRPVEARCDAPPLPAVLCRFVDWVAAYTLYPRGAVLKMVLSMPEALDPPAPATALVAADPVPDLRLTPPRQRVLAATADGPPRTARELALEAGASPAVVRGLVKAGALREVTVAPSADPVPDGARPGPALSPAQAAAAGELAAAVQRGEFSVTLLDGVPGSGKTEVYFQAVAAALAKGQQVLVLLPEIALGAQWLLRFRERFGVEPAQWHSELTQATRRRTWRAVAEGKAPVVVGARSALFLPFPDLGLIVVDEEHDAAFKQEDGVVYNARDMAVVRARLGGFPAVLVSATPSLESDVNAGGGRYARLHLPARHGGAEAPAVQLVDMRTDHPPRDRWLSAALCQAVETTLEAGEQGLLFLNRRGYAPLTLCRACGHRLQCPQCTAWLVEHRLTGRLQCHHCGHTGALPDSCPQCGGTDSLAACGPGVERLAEEVRRLFPEARLMVATSDTITGPRAAAELVRRMEAKEVDLIIGTQIVAKGYHFPLLTLVGVVDGDLGLAGGDLRAAERTFQLLYQVAGRAGRAAHPGRVMVQTYMPDHAVMQALASGDRDAFLAAEAQARRDTAMPPFGRLVALIVSGRDERAVDGVARALARRAPTKGPSGEPILVLGPAPAPLALLRGQHRRRLLLRAPREVAVQGLVRAWLAQVTPPAKVRVRVDVDPYSFM
ncbi:MAG: primosomal protein N' [Hyphomicrobiales bacterium]|nr:primosomal protein N' [Hyphomicrobiales bacterium]